MKKGFLILGILIALIALVLGTTVSAGEHHVIVVEENQVLVHKADSLSSENKRLCEENTTLKKENVKLHTLFVEDSISLKEDSVKKKELETLYKKALRSLEKLVIEDLTWVSPEYAYELLCEQLNRKATFEEYRNTLEDLYSKDLLYNYVSPDPYLKGKKVKQTDIPILAKKIAN